MILVKHIKTTQPTPKLSEMYLGPFEIIAQPSSHAYTFCLPQHLRAIHPIFHISQIEPIQPNPFPEHTESLPPPIKLEDGDEYKLKAILDSKINQRFKVWLRYYVEWEGYKGMDEQYVRIMSKPSSTIIHDFEGSSGDHDETPNPVGNLFFFHAQELRRYVLQAHGPISNILFVYNLVTDFVFVSLDINESPLPSNRRISRLKSCKPSIL
jgi:hypothetical protein